MQMRYIQLVGIFSGMNIYEHTKEAGSDYAAIEYIAFEQLLNDLRKFNFDMRWMRKQKYEGRKTPS